MSSRLPLFRAWHVACALVLLCAPLASAATASSPNNGWSSDFIRAFAIGIAVIVVTLAALITLHCCGCNRAPLGSPNASRPSCSNRLTCCGQLTFLLYFLLRLVVVGLMAWALLLDSQTHTQQNTREQEDWSEEAEASI